MAYFNEFPFTRSYDADLGWLIKTVKYLFDKFRRCPTWYGEWVSAMEYPPLAFVQYADKTYMSLRDVPINTPITDSYYWNEVNSVSEIILVLQQQVSQIQNEISKIPLGTINDNSKILCIGDSYGVLGTNWVDQLKIALPEISNDIYNACVSGGGLVGNAGENGYYITQLQTANVVKSDITHIIIAGGFNDAYQNSNGTIITPAVVNTKFAEIATYIKNNYPNADVYVGFLGYCGVTDDIAAANIATRIRRQCALMARYYRTAASRNMLQYMVGIENTLHLNSFFDATNIVYSNIFHPSASGNDEIATNILNAIRSGSCEQYIIQNLSIEPDSGITIAAKNAGGTTIPLTIEEKFINGKSICRFGANSVYVRIDCNVTGGNKILKIGKLTGDLCVFPPSNGTCRTTCLVSLVGTIQGATQARYGAAELLLQENNIYVILDSDLQTYTTVAIYPTDLVGEFGDS